MQSMGQKKNLNPNRCQSRTLCLSLNQPTRLARPPGKVSKRGTSSFVSKGPDLMRKLFYSGFGLSGDSQVQKANKQFEIPPLQV